MHNPLHPFRFSIFWPPHSLSVASHKEIVPIPLSFVPRPRQDLHSVESRTRSDQQQLSVCTSVLPTTGHDRAVRYKNTRTRLRSCAYKPPETNTKKIPRPASDPTITRNCSCQKLSYFCQAGFLNVSGWRDSTTSQIKLDKCLWMFMSDISTWYRRSIRLYQIWSTIQKKTLPKAQRTQGLSSALIIIPK